MIRVEPALGGLDNLRIFDKLPDYIEKVNGFKHRQANLEQRLLNIK